MRGILKVTLACMICLTVNAQVVKKDLIFVSANTSFSVNSGNTTREIDNGASTEKREVSNLLAISLTPKAGIMLLDNLGAGLSLRYNYTKENFITRDVNGIKTDEDKVNSNAVAVGPFIRYYIQQGSNYGIFINGEILAGSNRVKTENTENSIGTFQFNAGLGGQFFVNDNVAIEANLDYFRRNSDNSGVKDLFSGISFSAGFTIFLNAGKLATSNYNN